MTDAQEQIKAQMALYFDGLYHSDTDRLRRVFAPDARYVCATGGQLINMGLPEYLPVVAQREPPAARGEARRDQIVSITLAGDETALVIAHCAIGDRFFTDFLSFVRLPEGWRIIAKVFHFDLIPAAAQQHQE